MSVYMYKCVYDITVGCSALVVANYFLGKLSMGMFT